ncbi:MAG: hypothetical protein ACP5KE_06635 [Candidatus Methanodesulfokora sp.]|jgi:hypothetical protein
MKKDPWWRKTPTWDEILRRIRRRKMRCYFSDVGKLYFEDFPCYMEE